MKQGIEASDEMPRKEWTKAWTMMMMMMMTTTSRMQLILLGERKMERFAQRPCEGVQEGQRALHPFLQQ